MQNIIESKKVNFLVETIYWADTNESSLSPNADVNMFDVKHRIEECELSCRNYILGRHQCKITFTQCWVNMIEAKHHRIEESELSCRN